jgi:hypothetical protein
MEQEQDFFLNPLRRTIIRIGAHPALYPILKLLLIWANDFELCCDKNRIIILCFPTDMEDLEHILLQLWIISLKNS